MRDGGCGSAPGPGGQIHGQIALSRVPPRVHTEHGHYTVVRVVDSPKGRRADVYTQSRFLKTQVVKSEVIRDTVPYSYRYSCAYTVHRNLVPHMQRACPQRSTGQPCARAAYVVPALHPLAARARRLESIGDKKGRGAGERGRLEEREWHLERGAHLMRETIKASYVRS